MQQNRVISNSTANILESQVVAGVILERIQNKVNEQSQRMVEIANETNVQMQRSIEAFNEANTYIEKARDFVSPGNLPHILGPDSTKHGEIAENLEVNFRNGRDVLQQLKASARFLEEGKDRIGPTDYVINGIPVQSKYINGGDISTPNNSLSHIYEHLKKYPGYANDATQYGFPNQHGIYQMPKDQYAVLEKIVSGQTEGLSQRTIQSCQSYIERIEAETGKSITEVVRPGMSTYREVQLGRVDETINAEEVRYQDKHQEDVNKIREKEQLQREEAAHITDASWNEAFKAAGIGAAISGVTSGGLKIYSKIRNGRKLSEFTIDDWKEVGYDFAKGGLKGGVTGFSVYGLTKVGGFSAPFAGSIVTTAIGVTSLYVDYKKGKISKSDFADATCALSVEAGLSAIGASIGQVVIPIPVLGSIIGTVVAQSAFKISNYIFGEKEKELMEYMRKEYEDFVAKADAECQKILRGINDYFDKLGGLIEAALSPDPNKRLNGSIALAQEMGVPESEIIHTIGELDDFMMS